MRIRSILPKFYESEDVGAMSWETRLVFIGLWSYVDDNGVGRDVEALIASDLFPFDMSRDSRETLARVADSLQHLAEGGQIVRFSVEGKPLVFISRWDEYQRVDRPAKDRYPRPTSENAEIRETVASMSRNRRESVATGEGEKARRGGGEKQTSTEFVGARKRGTQKQQRGTRLDPDSFVPSATTRQTILTEKPNLDLAGEHRKFCDYWIGISGQRGTKLDWDATWRNWMRNADTRTNGNRRQQETDSLFERAAARLGVEMGSDS